jgi:hypothetical protein
MNNQAKYAELRSHYAQRLANHDQSVARLIDECVLKPRLAGDLHNAADDFMAFPDRLADFAPAVQGVLAMLAHQAAMALMLSVIERRIEIEACGK